MTDPMTDAETSVTTLPNGVRVLALRMPYLATAAVSVFVKCGSQHESERTSGISHFLEHMAFKGTHARDCQQINLDAERLGAEVNAHTDKDHTAYHMRGLARDAAAFVAMLADIVCHSSFPEAEIERERQVVLQEFAEDEDDAVAAAYKMFDKACYGEHPIARPVIGSRANIRRFTRSDLVSHVQRYYTGSNVIVGVAGSADVDRVIAAAGAGFGDLPVGSPNDVAVPAYVGGVRVRRMAGCGQTHVVLGFPVPRLQDDYQAAVVAAALFGEGMSSPLLDRVRERRGLAYHADCIAEFTELAGQFQIEASTLPEHVDAFFGEVARLLQEHAHATDPVGLERARNQITVRSLCTRESPAQRLEQAALDLFTFGRVRPAAELAAGVAAVGPADVRQVFRQMLDAGAAIALAGKIGKDADGRAARLFPRQPR